MLGDPVIDPTKYIHKFYPIGYVDEMIDGVVWRRPKTEAENERDKKWLEKSFTECKEFQK